ncbi:Guanine nucleotide exchange factor in Golgi transport N-terminal, putative [Angomonas deanei]|uniref:Guanine nucleotide exchange factor in Golgi transport N-terminal, putative n=1 Tax=Angomonas deanei TaxID=59799 RepID=A0A7G2C986_9TRYP|nr:Guanine nucleotide exchange factor in Golgi transport N-terminal, putative [Angomonas deanei]
MSKFHYVLAAELYTLLSSFLLPLLSSPVASFRQKHAFLTFIHDLFKIPHLVIALYINYDCNPLFDVGISDENLSNNNNNNENNNESENNNNNNNGYSGCGGFISILIDFVVEMSFTDYLREHIYYNNNNNNNNNKPLNVENWLNSDQQQLLRSECALVLHQWSSSLYRWISQDPHHYLVDYMNHQHGVTEHKNKETNHNHSNQTSKDCVWKELYLDNWSSSEEDENNNNNNNTNNGPLRSNSESISSFGSEILLSEDLLGLHSNLQSHHHSNHNNDMAAFQHQFGRHRNIRYHWKHVHHLLQNKRILSKALDVLNYEGEKKWLEVKQFLEEHGMITRAFPSSEEDLFVGEYARKQKKEEE